MNSTLKSRLLRRSGRGYLLPGGQVQMFKLQVKERNKKRQVQLHDSIMCTAYAYSMISLRWMVTIFMIGKYVITALISVVRDAKWLLKVIRLERYIFNLKIEPVLIWICSCFHKKPKQLECLCWHPIWFVVWVCLLKTLGSHHLFVYFP